MVDKVQSPLVGEGFEIDVFDVPAHEPTFTSVNNLAESLKDAGSDLLIGLGGGSVMDTTKIISALMNNPEYDCQELIEKGIKKDSLNQILIPTTAGTGSEVSPYAIAIDEEEDVKYSVDSNLILPDIAIVDPLMSMTCPPKQTAASGMDALAHGVECFLVSKHDPYTDAFALQTIRLVSKYLRKAYYSGGDLKARYNMSMAATMGGLCMILVPTNIGHTLSESLGPRYDIPHGVACGMITPYQIEYNMPACMERVSTLASYLGKNVQGLSPKESAIKTVEAVIELLKDLELPTSLKELNISKEDLSNYINIYLKLLNSRYSYLSNWNPRSTTEKNVSELLEKIWRGK
ncbi:hypothetical protein AKJ50_01970 [candidate division MSBL1 archaeon SCGC-AAA382A13]|uniref:Uncharacterized protein n=1 Tax=candidate division MSBL1 archaeon SCGC-AAA382A13 TaxID=1698279 RepID=A0A133VEK0_9EURY|nr:hypothetical protein AKJ50_01970 [candidate division MSBL1 archaeon SCGC-AAA382A13]